MFTTPTVATTIVMTSGRTNTSMTVRPSVPGRTWLSMLMPCITRSSMGSPMGMSRPAVSRMTIFDSARTSAIQAPNPGGRAVISGCVVGVVTGSPPWWRRR